MIRSAPARFSDRAYSRRRTSGASANKRDSPGHRHRHLPHPPTRQSRQRPRIRRTTMPHNRRTGRSLPPSRGAHRRRKIYPPRRRPPTRRGRRRRRHRRDQMHPARRRTALPASRRSSRTALCSLLSPGNQRRPRSATRPWPEPCPELDYACGLGTLSLLEGDIVTDTRSFRPVDGYLPVLRTPPTPDPALLEAYELTEPKQSAWWRDRLTRVRAVLDNISPQLTRRRNYLPPIVTHDRWVACYATPPTWLRRPSDRNGLVVGRPDGVDLVQFCSGQARVLSCSRGQSV